MPTGEHPPLGAPCWTDLWTSDVEGGRRSSRDLFGWEAREPDPVHGGHFLFTVQAQAMPAAPKMQYSTITSAWSDTVRAGIMGAAAFLPSGVAARWSTDWEVADVDAAVTRLTALGGEVQAEPHDSPHGRIAAVADPTGAHVKLRGPNVT